MGGGGEGDRTGDLAGETSCSLVENFSPVPRWAGGGEASLPGGRIGPGGVGQALFSRHLGSNFVYVFIFREKGREGEREGEKHQLVVSCTP